MSFISTLFRPVHVERKAAIEAMKQQPMVAHKALDNLLAVHNGSFAAQKMALLTEHFRYLDRVPAERALQPVREAMQKAGSDLVAKATTLAADYRQRVEKDNDGDMRSSARTLRDARLSTLADFDSALSAFNAALQKTSDPIVLRKFANALDYSSIGAQRADGPFIAGCEALQKALQRRDAAANGRQHEADQVMNAVVSLKHVAQREKRVHAAAAGYGTQPGSHHHETAQDLANRIATARSFAAEVRGVANLRG